MGNARMSLELEDLGMALEALAEADERLAVAANLVRNVRGEGARAVVDEIRKVRNVAQDAGFSIEDLGKEIEKAG